MAKYPKGECPLCGEDIMPKEKDIFKKNFIRRDILSCPECGAKILRCIGLGCRNYAEAGDKWDDNLCPSCKNPTKWLDAGRKVFGIIKDTKAVLDRKTEKTAPKATGDKKSQLPSEKLPSSRGNKK